MAEYKVTVGRARNGLFEYRVAGSPVRGRSGQPLFDACRQLKQMGADPAARCALFHGERADQWTLRCTIGAGADLDASDRTFRKRRGDHA